MNPSKKIVFIVEDNNVYARSLQAMIQSQCPEVSEVKIFHIGEMCLMELHRNPAIIIMDYFLNSYYADAHNGLEIIEQIKKQKPATKLIVLSSQDKPGVILEAIKQFDCVYVQKDQHAFKLVEDQLNLFLNRKRPASFEPWA